MSVSEGHNLANPVVTAVPNEVRRVASDLRSAFGPSVKLLRVTGAADLGNPKWDALCRLSDGEGVDREKP